MADRVENMRRVAEVTMLMVDAGLLLLASFISPFAAERRFARQLLQVGEFCEVFVDAPLEVVEAGDPKGLCRKERRDELANFTGVESPDEAPESPEVRIDTANVSADAAADQGVGWLRAMGILAELIRADLESRVSGSVRSGPGPVRPTLPVLDRSDGQLRAGLPGIVRPVPLPASPHPCGQSA